MKKWIIAVLLATVLPLQSGARCRQTMRWSSVSGPRSCSGSRDLVLQDSQVSTLRETLAWSEGQRRALIMETQDLNRRSRAFPLDGSDAEARSILEARLRLQERGVALFTEEQERLARVLSPQQRVPGPVPPPRRTDPSHLAAAAVQVVET